MKLYDQEYQEEKKCSYDATEACDICNVRPCLNDFFNRVEDQENNNKIKKCC